MIQNSIPEKDRTLKYDEVLVMTTNSEVIVGVYDTFTDIYDSIERMTDHHIIINTVPHWLGKVTKWEVSSIDKNFSFPYFIFKMKRNKWREFI